MLVKTNISPTLEKTRSQESTSSTSDADLGEAKKSLSSFCCQEDFIKFHPSSSCFSKSKISKSQVKDFGHFKNGEPEKSSKSCLDTLGKAYEESQSKVLKNPDLEIEDTAYNIDDNESYDYIPNSDHSFIDEASFEAVEQKTEKAEHGSKEQNEDGMKPDVEMECASISEAPTVEHILAPPPSEVQQQVLPKLEIMSSPLISPQKVTLPSPCPKFKDVEMKEEIPEICDEFKNKLKQEPKEEIKNQPKLLLKEELKVQLKEEKREELKAMLRLSINPFKTKVVSVLDEFYEYLDRNNLADCRTTHYLHNQERKETGSDCDEDNSDKHKMQTEGELPIIQNNTFGMKLKDMFERIEGNGKLASISDIARNELKGLNPDKDKEDYYAADDLFINNDEEEEDSDSESSHDECDRKFYKSFRFVPTRKLKKYANKINRRKAARKIIKNEEILEKCNKVEELRKNKACDSTNEMLGSCPSLLILQEIVDKVMVSKNLRFKHWKDNFPNILTFFTKMFEESDKAKIMEYLYLFRDKIKERNKLRSMFEALRKEIKNSSAQVNQLNLKSSTEIFEEILKNQKLQEIFPKIGKAIKESFTICYKITKYKFGEHYRSHHSINTQYVDKNLTYIQNQKLKDLDKNLCTYLLKRFNDIYDLFAKDSIFTYPEDAKSDESAFKKSLMQCLRAYMEKPIGYRIYSHNYDVEKAK
ncbi:unnamed protein product [Moneuplotes crassus]|uniref:Uncharacterized protein n=1 Tax=Euplotes crassus TaxID=5936 RepID=A0AAD1Y7I8_EUPCR|nr:unnamed protein product [Moneuplotes crassus]